MLIRVLLFIVVAVMGYSFARSLSKRFSLSQKQFNLLFVLFAGLLVIVGMVLLGRLPIQFILAPVGVAITFVLRMLPALMRLFPLWQMIGSRKPKGQKSAGDQKSTINTVFLSMELQHDNGEMDGEVLKGNFQSKRLSTMSVNELLELFNECQYDDDSCQVLQAYLDRTHPQWRELAGAEKAQQAQASVDDSVMTRELALDILGLSLPVSKKDITKAHRALMQKLHPDRGGSDYLAKKINAAKDLLDTESQ